MAAEAAARLGRFMRVLSVTCATPDLGGVGFARVLLPNLGGPCLDIPGPPNRVRDGTAFEPSARLPRA
mgnify:CR=1 FL=1